MNNLDVLHARARALGLHGLLAHWHDATAAGWLHDHARQTPEPLSKLIAAPMLSMLANGRRSRTRFVGPAFLEKPGDRIGADLVALRTQSISELVERSCLRQTRGQSRKRVARSAKLRKPAGYA